MSVARRRLRMSGAKMPVLHDQLWRTQEQFYRPSAFPSIMPTVSRLVLHEPLQSIDTCQHTPSPFLPLRWDPNRVRYRQWQSSPWRHDPVPRDGAHLARLKALLICIVIDLTRECGQEIILATTCTSRETCGRSVKHAWYGDINYTRSYLSILHCVGHCPSCWPSTPAHNCVRFACVLVFRSLIDDSARFSFRLKIYFPFRGTG